MKTHKPILITMGDLSGVGPELILKLFRDKPHLAKNTLIFGDTIVLEKLIRKFHLSLKVKNLPLVDLDVLKKYEDVHNPKLAGRAAYSYLEKAIAFMKKNKCNGIVTLPVNKKNISLTQKNFDGHTSYFARNFGVRNHVMFFYHPKQSCALYSEHIPIRNVAQSLNRKELIDKISIIHNDYNKLFGFYPTIAVLGLNPHCGEEGLIGSEDRIIIKALQKLQANKINALGPFPADGFFSKLSLKQEFNVVLGMYHDQILPPFKMTYGDRCVNITLGLPIVRTSVAHGTCPDIAGNFTVNPRNFYETIRLTKKLIFRC